jgi:hypothetical protein
MFYSRYRLRFCLIFSLILSTGCGRAERESEEVRSPLIHFPTLTKSLGDATQGELDSRIVSFAFENRGLSSLEIVRISTSCGCAVANVSHADLLPGDLGTIAIQIKRPAAGRKDVTITVRSNDPLHSSVTLRLDWNAVAPLTFSPASLDFGTLLPGEAAEQFVTVVDNDSGTSPCKIDRVVCSPSKRLGIFDEENQSVTGSPASAGKYRIRLDAGASSGRRNGKVLLYFADCSESWISLPVSWRVQPLIEVTPGSLYLGHGKPGEIRTGRIVISSRRSEHLEVSDIFLAENSLQEAIEMERLTKHSILLILKLRLPSKPGITQTDLVINCTGPVEHTIRVPVSGSVTVE